MSSTLFKSLMLLRVDTFETHRIANENIRQPDVVQICIDLVHHVNKIDDSLDTISRTPVTPNSHMFLCEEFGRLALKMEALIQESHLEAMQKIKDNNQGGTDGSMA